MIISMMMMPTMIMLTTRMMSILIMSRIIINNDDINAGKNDNHVINRPPARPDWSRLAPPAKHCHNSNTLKYEREQIEFKDSIKIESGYEINSQ